MYSIAILLHMQAWCRILSFMKIYFTSCTFAWMLCEGYYLHRLISRAFETLKKLYPLYLMGWGELQSVSTIHANYV